MSRIISVSRRTDIPAFYGDWSKNFKHFLENLRIIEALGYKFYFNYTVTGLPGIFDAILQQIPQLKP